jgi:hypothetical protein
VEHQVFRPDGTERVVVEQAGLLRHPATGKPLELVGFAP